jgi:hypothetical protein
MSNLKTKVEKLTYKEHMKCIESNGNHIGKVPVSMVDGAMVKLARKNYARVGQIPSKFHTFGMLVKDSPSYSQKDAKEFAETYCVSSFGISVTAFAKLVVKNELPNMSKVPENLRLHVQNAVYSKIFNFRPEVVTSMPKEILENMLKKNSNFIRRVYNGAYKRSTSSYGTDWWIGYQLLNLFKEKDFSEETLEYIQGDLLEKLKSVDRRPSMRVDLTSVPEFLISYEAKLQWMTNDGNALRHIKEEDRCIELCKAAVNSHGDSLSYVPEDLKKEFYIDAVKTGGLASIPEGDRTDRLCTIAVESNSKEIEAVPEQRKTYSICLSAIDSNPELIKFVPEENRDEEMIIRFLISVFKGNYGNEFVLNRDWQDDGSTPLMQVAFDSVIQKDKLCSWEIIEAKQSLINKAIEREPGCFANLITLQQDDRWTSLHGLINLDICLTAFKGNNDNISFIPKRFLVQVFIMHSNTQGNK